jgi:non-haem Fe2+, alpha-ketoglutarate-dependent halogenase
MSISTRQIETDRSVTAEQEEEERKFFKENGYLPPFTLFEPEVAATLCEQVRIPLLFKKKKAIYPESKMNYDRHLDIKVLSDIVSHPAIVRRVQNLLGSKNILCWRTEWFPKYPGDIATGWHQTESFPTFEGDSKLVPTQPHEGSWELTVWFGFTEAKRETACLKVIPKSHKTWYFDEKKQVSFNPDTIMKGTGAGFYGYDWEPLKIDPDWKVDESQALHFEMDAGQVVMFTSRLLHASEPNITKDRTRMGIAMRYVPTDVRVYPYHDGQWTMFGETFSLDKYAAMLVGGQDTFGHNKITLPLTE